MEGLSEIIRLRPRLDERLRSGIYASYHTELSVYTLCEHTVAQHNRLVQKSHANKDSTLVKVVREINEDTAAAMFEILKNGSINPLAADYQAIKHLLDPIIQRDILDEHYTAIDEADSKTESDIEEDKLGYILLIGFDPLNHTHQKSVKKEEIRKYAGERLAEYAPENFIKGNVKDSKARDALMKLGRRDGATLFTWDGGYIDGRLTMQDINLDRVPTIEERFPSTARLPETQHLTEHGLDFRVGTRGLSTLAQSYHHPDIIFYTLGSTGQFTVRRYHKGVVTASTLPHEGEVARHIITNYKEQFMQPQ
jgi:hypothetical protein